MRRQLVTPARLSMTWLLRRTGRGGDDIAMVTDRLSRWLLLDQIVNRTRLGRSTSLGRLLLLGCWHHLTSILIERLRDHVDGRVAGELLNRHLVLPDLLIPRSGGSRTRPSRCSPRQRAGQKQSPIFSAPRSPCRARRRSSTQTELRTVLWLEAFMPAAS